jgi:hypothetical protein
MFYCQHDRMCGTAGNPRVNSFASGPGAAQNSRENPLHPEQKNGMLVLQKNGRARTCSRRRGKATTHAEPIFKNRIAARQ